MGCDIHFEEGYTEGLDQRSYNVFSFLAGVRNYMEITPVSPPRGFPEGFNASEEYFYGGGHSQSWLSIKELMDFNYDQEVKVEGADGDSTSLVDENGVKQTYRDFLGEKFIDRIKKLHDEGEERIVFWFDN